MITSAELHRLAASEGLRFDQIEKDYVILWLLSTLRRVPGVSVRWTLKGGTCLRHCYYPGYRFSDDIDFTCGPESDNTQSSLATLGAATRMAESETGLRLVLKEPLASVSEMQLEVGIEYSRGGARRQHLPVVQVHLTFDEPLIRPAEKRAVRPAYSDLGAFHVGCYSMMEIAAEKLRSLLQQREKWPRPRDLYDLWFMLCRQGEPLRGPELRALFEGKCRSRGIVPDSSQLFSEQLREWNRQAWAKQLTPTMRAAPDYDVVWRDWTSIRATIF